MIYFLCHFYSPDNFSLLQFCNQFKSSNRELNKGFRQRFIKGLRNNIKSFKKKKKMSGLKQQQKPEIWNIYEKGDFIDALDSQGDWRVGYIVEKNVTTKTYKVRFDGWSNKYDESYNFNSQKLKQFRSIVVGYTGQESYPALRHNWKFDLRQLQDKLLELNEYVKNGNPIHMQNAHEFNQYYRGHNYFYSDFLMTTTYSSTKEIHTVLQFFKYNIKLIEIYLTFILNNFDKFINDLQKTNNQHLDDVEVAWSKAYYEMFDLVYTILGCYQRNMTFFKDNQQLLKIEYQHLQYQSPQDAHQFEMTELFKNLNGFGLLDSILKKIATINKPMPNLFIYSLIHLAKAFKNGSKALIRQKLIGKFQQVAINTLKFIGDKQMKDFTQKQFSNFIWGIFSFSRGTNVQRSTQKWVQSMQLSVYFKMISCQFFDKKLKGVSLLQQFIEENVEEFKKQEEKDLIESGALYKWIEQSKVFDALFISDKPELIKKSTELIKYLYQRDNEMQKYIKLLWKYREGKHEAILKQIYNFMGEVPKYSNNEEFTRNLFKKYLSKLDETFWDAEYLKMIKNYTVNALNNSKTIDETFGYNIFYNYLLKNQSDGVIIGYLIEVLSKLKQSKVIEMLVTDYFSSIEKNIQPKLHVILLIKILKERIVDVQSIKINCQEVIQKRIILTKDSLTEDLQQQFELLNEYLRQSKQVIPTQNFICFWNEMIDSKSRAHFLKFLFKVRDSGKVISTNLINPQTKRLMLQDLWTEEYLKTHKVDDLQATFLLEIFKFVNEKLEKIKRTNLVFEVLDDKLMGIQKLHSVYMNSTDPKVDQILAKGLAEIYHCSSNSLFESGIDLLGDLVRRILTAMKSHSQQKNLPFLNKMLKLVQQLILRDQEIFSIPQIIRAQEYKIIYIKNLQTKEQRTLRINLLLNVYSVKKLIGEKFNLELNKFDLILNDDEKISYESYFKIFGDVCSKLKVGLIYRNKESSRTKNYLAQYLEVLFQLLGNKFVQEKVWNIISKFSISQEIREKLQHAQNQLQILANNNSFYKELYIFKVAYSIQGKWWNEPPHQLTTFFINRLKKANTKTEIQRQYIMVCGKLLENIVKRDETINQKIISETFSNLFEILKRVLIQSHKIENINISYVKKFIQSFFSIGEQLHVHLVKNETIKTSPDAMSLMLTTPEVQTFFKLCIIEYRHEEIRRLFPIKLSTIGKHNKEKHATKLASMIFEDLLDASVTSQTKTLSPLIIYGCFMLEQMDGFLKQFYAEKKSSYFDKLWTLIKKQASEQNCETVNNRLQCYLSLIKFTIKEVPSQELQEFIMFILSDCLFHENNPKCKSKETRTSTFNILVKCIKCNKSPFFIYHLFSRFQQMGTWRTRRLDDWTISQSERVKSTTNYVGLRNLGCICYMNSFFQQLFMIQEFRQAILFAEIPEYDPKTIEDDVMFQIKKMFMNLIYSEKKAYNPIYFCEAFKDYDGNPTDVNLQMDIDEFSANLFDKIQDLFRRTSYKGFIKENFEGVYSNEIICKGCSKVSQSEESFLSLGLTVKNKNSIHESLETMIKGDTLDGQNAYFCERCKKKVSAVKRVCLKKLPNNLIISLKRFEFNFTSNTKNKLNDYCEFPQDLDLKEYSYHHLRNTENLMGQKDQQMEDDSYYQYKLKGVVIHTGSADSGHYYSLIQERNGQERWIQFNDSTVRKFNIENLSDEAFGGYTVIGSERKQKIKNAYLLVYERMQKINPIENLNESQGDSFENMEMYKDVLEIIKLQNYQYIVENVLFSAEYAKFIQSLIDEAAKNKTNLELHKFIISTILTVIIRQKSLSDHIEILKNVYNACCKGNKDVCAFIMSEFCDIRIYEQFFRSCPLKETRRNVANWLEMILIEVDDQLREKFIKLVIFKITKDKENNFQALTILNNLSGDEKCLGVMLKHNLIGRLLENVLKIESRFFKSTDIPGPFFQKQKKYFGFEQVIQKTEFELKKIKYDNESGYVWATIIKIISKFQLQTLPTILHPKELQSLYLRDKIEKILPQLKTKFDIDSFTDLLVYLSQGDLQFSKMLFGLIEKAIKELQSKKFRQYFILFHKLINVQDHLEEERIAGIFNLIRGLKANEKYNMDCTVIELWICKLVNQNQSLRNYLIRERNLLQYLASLPLKRVPSDDSAKKNVKFVDSLINKLHGIPFPVTSKGYAKILGKVEHFYQKLLKNEYKRVDWFQSGDYITFDKVAINDRIAYFDVKDNLSFEEAVVKDIFSDKLFIYRKQSSNRSFWIWKDDQKLTVNLRAIKKEVDEFDSSRTSDMEQDEIDQITAI